MQVHQNYIKVVGDDGETRTINVTQVNDATVLLSRVLQKFNITASVDEYALFLPKTGGGTY
jgi:hypothetical protein